MNALKIWLITLLVFQFGQVISQHEEYFKNDMYPPLDIQMYLSGTFGELRSNHFHSGLDIKTQGVEGLNVYSADDGYVSRIKVSQNGYGKALYITHSNGIVSVYGHLKNFNNAIQDYVKAAQYEKESFSIQLFPKKDELIVKKGEVIAYSGSTGGSSGPHLHYEFREQSSQHTLNPLFFKGISVKDTYRPKILEVVIYPVDEYSLINGKNDTAFYMVSGSGKQHYLDLKKKVKVSGRVSFGIRSYDPMDDISNKNGVYQIEMQIDTQQVFKLEMDKLSFATTRYLNSLIDYGYYKSKRRRVIRTQIDTNNRIFNYRDIVSNGIYTFNDEQEHTIRFIVSDVYNNTSKLSFDVVSEPMPDIYETADHKVNEGTFFQFRSQNSFREDNISLSFPINSFYQSFYFDFDTLEATSATYSQIFKVHNRFTPIQKHYKMAIKPSRNYESVKEKLYIALLNDEGAWYIGSDWDEDELTTSSRLFGMFAVMADTLSPEIKPVNIYNKKKINGQKTIQFKIKDDETGIGKFRGTIDGQWILMEYDPKFNLLTYYIDDRLKSGRNQFKLEVEDMLGNKSMLELTLLK